MQHAEGLGPRGGQRLSRTRFRIRPLGAQSHRPGAGDHAGDGRRISYAQRADLRPDADRRSARHGAQTMIAPVWRRLMRAHLPTTPGAAIASLAALLMIGLLTKRLADFLFGDAAWHGTAIQCRSSTGLCWALLRERGAAFIYGFYPAEARWRLDLMLAS